MNRVKARVSIIALCILLVLTISSGCTSTVDNNEGARIPVSGKVLDAAGNGVEGAQVTVSGVSDVKPATTDEDGNYILKEVPLGQFQVIVQVAGYQAITRGISLDEAEPRVDENFTIFPHISDLYLAKYDDTTAQAVWRSVSETSAYLEYGTNGKTETPVSYAGVGLRHALFMTNLVKSVEYTFKVKFDGSSYSDNRTFKLNDSNFPTAPYLRSPLAVGHNSVKIGWTREGDDDFASYRVYRSISAPASGAGEEIAVIVDRDVTTFTDEGLSPLATYYYRVVTVHTNNLATASNQLQITTEDLPNEPPAAVELKYPVEKTYSSFTLEWTMNQDADFESYRVYYSTAPGVSVGSYLGTSITDRSKTQGFVKGLDRDTTYYFKVYVYDEGGLCVGSNEVSGTTDSNNFPPKAVALYSPEYVTTSTCALRWSHTVDSDFYSYRIYRDTAPNVSEDDFLVAEITDPDQITYLDTALTEGVNYYYRIYTVDTGDKTTDSNEIGVTVLNNNPAASLLSVTAADSSSVSLAWTRCNEVDFDHYSIYRSENYNATLSNSNMIQFISDRDTLTYTDNNDGTGLTSNRTYYYWLVVYDLGGAGMASDATPATTIDSSSFSGTVSSDLVIGPGNSPLRITGDVTVTGGAVLQILGGVTVEFAAGSDSIGSGDPLRSEIIVKGGLFNRGGLVLRGTRGSPVMLVSDGGSASAPGDWGGVRIESGSYVCYFDYVVIRSATTGILNASDRIEVARTMVTGCSSHGMDNTSGKPYIYNSSFTFNGGAGIHVSGGNPSILSCNITDNADRGIYGGGGILGAQGNTQGVFLARNNGSTEVDTTGQNGTFPIGGLDGVMDTDSGALVSPIQIDNVDIIYSLVYEAVEGADPW